jgi:hypothetical protein
VEHLITAFALLLKNSGLEHITHMPFKLSDAFNIFVAFAVLFFHFFVILVNVPVQIILGLELLFAMRALQL